MKLPSPPRLPWPHPKSQRTKKLRAAFYDAIKLTTKISDAIVFPCSGELGTEAETLRPRPRRVSSLNHLNPFAAAVPLAAHLGSARVQS